MCMLVVHPVLSGPAKERIENSAIKELIVTNSILLDDTRKPSNTKELSVVDYLLKQLFEYMNVNQ